MENVIINNQIKLASLDQIHAIVTTGENAQVQISNGFAFIAPEAYDFGGDIYALSTNFADVPPVQVSDNIRLHALKSPMRACGKMSRESVITADGLWAVEEIVNQEVKAEPWYTVGSGVRATSSTSIGQYTKDCNIGALVRSGYTVAGPLVFNVTNMSEIGEVELASPTVNQITAGIHIYFSSELEVAQLEPGKLDNHSPFKWLNKYWYPVKVGADEYVVVVEIASDNIHQALGRTESRHWTPASGAREGDALSRHENPMFSRDTRDRRYTTHVDPRDIRQDSRRLRLGEMSGRDMTQNSPLRLRDVLDPERVGHVSSAVTANAAVDAKVHPTREPRRSIDTLAPHTTFYSGLELEDVKYVLSELGYDQSGLTCTDTGVFNSEYGYRGVIAANHVGLLNDIQDIHDLKEMVKNPEYIVTRIHNTMLPYTDLKAILHHWGFDGTLELDISPHTYFYNGTLSPKYKEILEQAVNTEALRLKQHHLHSDVCTAKKLQSRAVSLGYDSVIVSEPEETTARIVVMGEMTRDDITEVLTGKKSYSGKSTRISTRLSPDKLQAVLTRYGYTDELVYEEKVNIFYRYQYRGYIHDNLLQMLSANGDYRHIRRSITAIKTSKSIADVRAILRTTPYKRRLLDWTIKSTDVVHHLVYLGKLPVDILAVLESPKVD